MTPGVAGFKPQRLTEARQARGLTGVSLADLAGMASKHISYYEKGRSTPSESSLLKLASALRMPVEFFLLPDRSVERGATHERSMSAVTKAARLRGSMRLLWLFDIARYAAQFIQFPPVDLPDLNVSPNPLLISSDDIESLAEDLRTHWTLGPGPITNTVRLLENHGVLVARGKLEAETLEGNSERPPDGFHPIVFIGTDKGTPARWRFDAAHELGHLILHHTVGAAELAKPLVHAHVEKQAHRFAGAFLLPAAEFGDELYAPTLDAFVSLKRRWKVSVAAMITRASDLGLISEDKKKSLWILYSHRRWRRTEPLDDSMTVEEPRMLGDALDKLITEGGQCVDDICASVGLSPQDLEILVGRPLASGSSILTFRNESGGRAAARNGNVVPLRRL